MIAVVIPHKTHGFFIKPDSSLVKGSEDYFPSSHVTEICMAISLVVRISKTAKCVSSEFASRYYMEYTTGLVLYPENLIKSESYGLFSSGKILAMDNTTYVSQHFYQIAEIGKGGFMTVMINDNKICDFCITPEINTLINMSLEETTKYMTLKNGDLVFLELSDRIPLLLSNNVKVNYCLTNHLDFSIR